MKDLTINISYSWKDEKNNIHETKANIGGDWNQWGGTQEELFEIMPLTESLNKTANEFIGENCDYETEED